jgi:cysteine desulfurase/selenocysteine lyase
LGFGGERRDQSRTSNRNGAEK